MPPPISVFIPVDVALGQEISALQASGSRITDFTTGSGIRSIFEAVAVVVSNASATADQLQLDSYLDTATGDALDALGAGNWMVPRLPAVAASGVLTITRQSTTGTLLIPAGWSQLATSPTVPGETGIAVLTTDDANFAAGVATAAVPARAVLGGVAGNLSAGTFLTPLAPVNGISSQNGFQVTTPFTNGVDVESDDRYRARIPLAVQGRVLGRKVSFLAAALSVPGVLSAGVLGAGDTRGDGSIVPAGSIEVYYQGSAGLLTAVTEAAANAATANQNPQAFASSGLSAPRGQQRVSAAATVWMLPGGDAMALGIAVAVALRAYVNGVGNGGTARQSLAAEAVLGTPGVSSVNLPLDAFCLYPDVGATDLPFTADSYPNLDLADVLVTVNTI